MHMQCAPHLWVTSANRPWQLLQLLIVMKPLLQWPAAVRLQILKVLALSQALPVECAENGNMSASWSAAFLTPVLQHMLECEGGSEDRALCETIVYNCLCHVQLHHSPDTAVRHSTLIASTGSAIAGLTPLFAMQAVSVLHQLSCLWIW